MAVIHCNGIKQPAYLKLKEIEEQIRQLDEQ